MRCENCQVEVPPAFVRLIEKNECPACGEAIMSEDTQTLVADLAEALREMPNDPMGLAGWLVSNYRLQKVGEGEPTGFYRGRRMKTRESEEILPNDPEQVSGFMARAGADKITAKKNPKIDALRKLRKQAYEDQYAYDAEPQEEEDSYESQLAAEEEAMQRKLQEAQREGRQLSKAELLMDEGGGIVGGDRPATPEELETLVSEIQNYGEAQERVFDEISNQNKHAQKLRLQKLQKQAELSSFGEIGMIKRGGS